MDLVWKEAHSQMLRDHIFLALTRLASSRGRNIVYLLAILATTVSLILLTCRSRLLSTTT